MTYFDLLLCALAAWHAVEVWHHGSIFAGARARLEVSDNFFTELLLCPFCLSLHVAFWVTVFYVTAGLLPGAVFWRLPILGLAVARTANLLNDGLHSICRTPRPGVDDGAVD